MRWPQPVTRNYLLYHLTVSRADLYIHIYPISRNISSTLNIGGPQGILFVDW
jgi:hypothetical protein